jgi:hypothetical protein
MRTIVTFESDAFNSAEPREYFINDCCFGDDVARALIDQLRSRGAVTEPEPGQEDFGWYLTFEAGASHQLVIGYRPDADEAGTWICWLERNAGLIGSLLGRRRRVLPEAATVINEVLAAIPSIRNVRWHTKKAFDRGDESESALSPTMP